MRDTVWAVQKTVDDKGVSKGMKILEERRINTSRMKADDTFITVFHNSTKLPNPIYSISKQARSDYTFYTVVKGTKHPKTVALIIEVKMTTNPNFVNAVPQVSLI